MCTCTKCNELLLFLSAFRRAVALAVQTASAGRQTNAEGPEQGPDRSNSTDSNENLVSASSFQNALIHFDHCL
jgi:hypothetical protein